MEEQAQNTEQKTTEEKAKEQIKWYENPATWRRTLEGFLFLVIIPSVGFGYPKGEYESIIDWWETGKAQLSIYHARGAMQGFWSDDILGNLFANVTLLIVENFIPLWNAFMSDKTVRYLGAAILCALAYDLLKVALRPLYKK